MSTMVYLFCWPMSDAFKYPGQLCAGTIFNIVYVRIYRYLAIVDPSLAYYALNLLIIIIMHIYAFEHCSKKLPIMLNIMLIIIVLSMPKNFTFFK